MSDETDAARRWTPPPESPGSPRASLPVPGARLTALVGAAAAGLIAVVGAFEGLRTDPYRDVVGVWTVCYGETQAPMRRYSKAECDAMLADRLADYAGPVLKRNPELKGHDAQLLAATSLAYNIGTAAYARSGVARQFSAGNWRAACDAFLRWNTAGSRVQPSLVTRRAKERAICLRGL